MNGVSVNRKKQLSGYSVASILNPVPEKRSTKNFGQLNRSFISALEKKNKENSLPIEEKRAFKLKQFENVPSRIGSRPSTAATSSSSEKKNFIRLNKSIQTPSKQPISFKEPVKLGKVPDYLVKRKMEWAKAERERQEQLEQIQVPDGMKLLSEEERLENLELLEQHQKELSNLLSKLSITSDFQTTVKKRHQIESDLRQTEKSLEIFRKPLVFVELD